MDASAKPVLLGSRSVYSVCVWTPVKPDSSGDAEKLANHLGVSQRRRLGSGLCVELDAACVASAFLRLIVGLCVKIKHLLEADTKREM